ncbi:MAG: hypothetical protein WA705_17475 [Candidatus Ozemobacteraceae bacterium]
MVAENKPFNNHKRQSKTLPLWFGPATSLATLLCLFMAIFWLLQENTYKIQGKELVTNAELVCESIRLRPNGNRDYLLMLAKERGDGFLDAKSFQERCSRHVADHPEMICINWVDAGFLITDVAPIAEVKEHLIEPFLPPRTQAREQDLGCRRYLVL